MIRTTRSLILAAAAATVLAVATAMPAVSQRPTGEVMHLETAEGFVVNWSKPLDLERLDPRVLGDGAAFGRLLQPSGVVQNRGRTPVMLALFWVPDEGLESAKRLTERSRRSGAGGDLTGHVILRVTVDPGQRLDLSRVKASVAAPVDPDVEVLIRVGLVATSPERGAVDLLVTGLTMPLLTAAPGENRFRGTDPFPVDGVSREFLERLVTSAH